MVPKSPKLTVAFEIVISVVVLGLLLTFTYTYFFLAPYTGFRFEADSGIVHLLFNSQNKTEQQIIEIGDRLIAVNGIDYEKFTNDRRQTLFTGFKPGDVIPIIIERDGETLTLDYRFPVPSQREIINRFNSQWLLPYVFLGAGLATLIFIRPRSLTSYLLAAFNFLAAIWLSAGVLSSSHLMGSSWIMRSVIWLWLPVTLHLHWVFPKSFSKFPKWLTVILYLAFTLCAIAEYLQIMPSQLYMVGFLITLLGSITLLGLHYIFQKDQRKTIHRMGLAFSVALIAPITMVILETLGIRIWFLGVSILGISSLPGFYFFIIYQQQIPMRHERVEGLLKLYLASILGGIILSIILSVIAAFSNLSNSITFFQTTAALLLAIIAIVNFSPFLVLPSLSKPHPSSLETITGNQTRFTANRAAALLFFLILILTPLVILFSLVTNNVSFPGTSHLINLATAAIVALLSILIYPRFERRFERYLLSIPLASDTLVHTYTDHIATRLSLPELVNLLQNELLPSLLIRQSALYWQPTEGNLQSILTYGLLPEQLPTENQITALIKDTKQIQFQPNITTAKDHWVKIALPLKINNKSIGIWLIGYRDPSNHYNPEDIPLLQTLANQTAIALTNIQQADTLHALYAVNIETHEDERRRLARDLHDNVLNKLANIGIYLDGDTLTLVEPIFKELSSSLRETVNNLRPPMLDYGLGAALEQLVDDLSDNHPEKPLFHLEIENNEQRYPADVELHLFRIIQQACDNAVKHAQCNHITISGTLKKDSIELTVKDDGIGMPGNGQFNLTELLENNHFGMVNMLERAELAKAALSLESEPQQGSTLFITYTQQES